MNIFINLLAIDDADDDDQGLSLGTPVELWLGLKGESEEERAARLDAGRDILAENLDLLDFVTHITVEAIEDEAIDLLTDVTSSMTGKGPAAEVLAQ